MPRISPSNINFKLRQLNLLTALAEAGTLKGAASQIGLSQPGATRLLRDLEEMLGVTLFDRVKGRMVVTPAGEIMIERAGALQSEMLSAYQATMDAAAGHGGTLSLGVFSSISPGLLAEALSRFERLLPKARLEVKEAPQQLLVDSLRRGELDTVVVRLTESEHLKELNYDILYTDDFRVVCGVDHPLSKLKRAPTAVELVGYRWLLASSGSALRHRIDTYFASHAGHAPDGTVETRSILVHLSLLTKGEHLGILPTRVAARLVELRLVKVLKTELQEISGVFAFVTRPEAIRRRAIELLRTAFMEAASDAG